MVDWSEGQSTPRKYKSIFFVRCKSCRSIPCPAGKATAEDPAGSGFCFRGSWSVARGKRLPAAEINVLLRPSLKTYEKDQWIN